MKIAIQRATDLPEHVYPVAGSISELIANSAALSDLARAVRRDLERDLAEFEIADGAVARQHLAALATVAVIDARWNDVLEYVEEVRRRHDKANQRLLWGYQLRALAVAKQSEGGDSGEAYRSALRQELARVPVEQCLNDLRTDKAALELQSESMLLALVEQQLDPASRRGSIPLDLALAALRAGLLLREMAPYRTIAMDVLAEVLRAQAPREPAARAPQVRLDGIPGLEPVTIGIWDTGVDVTLFPGSLWCDEGPAAGDGGGGQMRHGRAWNWWGDPVTGYLRPLEIGPPAVATAVAAIKGFTELQAGLDTPDAAAFRAKMAAMSRSDVASFVESINFVMNYAHGTYVAGLAMEGNPAARILSVRCDHPWRITARPIDDAWSEGQCRLMSECVRFLVRAGARVVNMSWAFSPRQLERMLARQPARSSASNHAVARRWFQSIDHALRTSLENAPDVLFVAAAGNGDVDTSFQQVIPASYPLENVLTAGAVDAMGREALFTSYGKVDVYANGLFVESVLPGGERQAWSGTSAAAPQVANLAAKILAVSPGLTTAAVKEIILSSADEVTSNGRRTRLLNSRRALVRVMGEATLSHSRGDVRGCDRARERG